MLNKLRHFNYRGQYRYGQNLNLKRPVDVSLELASHCNMDCVYCYHSASDTPFTKGYMPKETALEIVTQAAMLKVPSLKFNWKGESTLNPHYLDVVEAARGLKRKSTFLELLANSNFKFSSKKIDVFEALSMLTKVKVSYDSFNKEVFETQRAGGDHDLTTNNIDIFYNYPERKKNKTKIVIQAVRSHLNKDEDIEGQCRKRWPDAEVSIRDMVGGRVDGVKEFKPRDYSERKPCLQAFARVIFNHKGKAYPCCPDIGEKLCMGDIRQETLWDIFNGPRARNVRNRLVSGKAFDRDPCKNCSSFESFKGFRPRWGS